MVRRADLWTISSRTFTKRLQTACCPLKRDRDSHRWYGGSQGSLEEIVVAESTQRRSTPTPSIGHLFSKTFRPLTYVGVLASLLAVSPARAACQYDVTVIEGPPCPPYGPQPTVGMALNAKGAVVGYYCACDCKVTQGFLWSADGGFGPLEMPQGVLSSEASDISARNWIAGWVIPSTQYGALAFVHDGNQATLIFPPPGGAFSEAHAVNGQGRVVGATGDGTPYFKAFYWENGALTLIQPTFGPRSLAFDVSEDGRIAGWMGQSPETNAHPFLWAEGKMSDLGLLPGTYSGVANAISESGEVAGSSWLPNPSGPGFVIHATWWAPDSREATPAYSVLDLGTLPGYTRSQALGINSLGQIVGNCSYPDPNEWRAFLWQNGVIYDLNAFIPANAGILLTLATDINDAGQITGWANMPPVPGAPEVAVLLTPHPQPLGDLDGDCNVDITDFLGLLSAWGPCPQSGSCPADLNNNGSVDIVDVLTLLSNWSQ